MVGIKKGKGKEGLIDSIERKKILTPRESQHWVQTFNEGFFQNNLNKTCLALTWTTMWNPKMYEL